MNPRLAIMGISVAFALAACGQRSDIVPTTTPTTPPPKAQQFMHVEISVNEVVAGAEGSITFDSSKLEYVGVKPGSDKIFAAAHVDGNNLNLGVLATQASKGTLVEVSFRVKAPGAENFKANLSGITLAGKSVQLNNTLKTSNSTVNLAAGYSAIQSARTKDSAQTDVQRHVKVQNADGSSTLQPDFVLFPLGDFDQDGSVRLNDAVNILHAATGTIAQPTAYQSYTSDTSGNSKLSVLDAVIALLKSVDPSLAPELAVSPEALNVTRGSSALILAGNKGGGTLPALKIQAPEGVLVRDVTPPNGVGKAYRIDVSSSAVGGAVTVGSTAGNDFVDLSIITPEGTGSISGRIFTPYVPAATLSALNIPEKAEFVPGQVLVKFKPQAKLQSRTILNALGLNVARSLPGDMLLISRETAFTPAQGIKANSTQARSTLELVAQLRSRGDVEFATPNYIRRATTVATDPMYGQQWHYGLAKVNEAWYTTTGSADVTVAVLDTGILYREGDAARSHPDFDCGRTVAGYDFVARDADPYDEGPIHATGYHGTHVAGTVGACTNNGKGVAGVDWNAKLQHIRVLGANGGSDADIAMGIYWAAGYDLTAYGIPLNANPAHVLNLSLGGLGASAAMQQAIHAANAKGSIVVVAAGNSTDDARNYSPAGAEGVITVGAVGPSGNLSYYSNYGPAIEIMAPGGEQRAQNDPNGVLSTLGDGAGGFNYGFYQGTSMASPHVAGIVALMKSVKPDLDWVRATAYLQKTATPMTHCTQGCGAGLVNAARAVLAAKNNEPIGAFLQSSGELDLALHTTGSFTLKNFGDMNADYHLTLPSYMSADADTVSGSIAPGQSVVVNVTLDRAGMTDGAYVTAVTVKTAEQTLAVPVRFKVGSGISDIGEIKTQLWQCVNQSCSPLLNSSTTYSNKYQYSFSKLVAGTYVAVAYTDSNNDGVTETWAYRLTDVKDGQAVTGVDITLENVVHQWPPKQSQFGFPGH